MIDTREKLLLDGQGNLFYDVSIPVFCPFKTRKECCNTKCVLCVETHDSVIINCGSEPVKYGVVK